MLSTVCGAKDRKATFHPLNEVTADKIRDYRTDYNNRPSNSFVITVDDIPGLQWREHDFWLIAVAA